MSKLNAQIAALKTASIAVAFVLLAPVAFSTLMLAAGIVS